MGERRNQFPGYPSNPKIPSGTERNVSERGRVRRGPGTSALPNGQAGVAKNESRRVQGTSAGGGGRRTKGGGVGVRWGDLGAEVFEGVGEGGGRVPERHGILERREQVAHLRSRDQGWSYWTVECP